MCAKLFAKSHVLKLIKYRYLINVTEHHFHCTPLVKSVVKLCPGSVKQVTDHITEQKKCQGNMIRRALEISDIIVDNMLHICSSGDKKSSSTYDMSMYCSNVGGSCLFTILSLKLTKTLLIQSRKNSMLLMTLILGQK